MAGFQERADGAAGLAQLHGVVLGSQLVAVNGTTVRREEAYLCGVSGPQVLTNAKFKFKTGGIPGRGRVDGQRRDR